MNIRWTAEAERTLREIHDYIARDKPSAARRTVRGIYDKIQKLRRFPELGYRYEYPAERPIRILLYGHFRIVYVIPSGEVVEILGVYHAAMDLDSLLRPPT